MHVYLTGTWSTESRRRQLAADIRGLGCTVADHADPACRTGASLDVATFPPRWSVVGGERTEELPDYADFLDQDEWIASTAEMRAMIDACDVLVCLLPGDETTGHQVGYAIGKDKKVVVVGEPEEGVVCPTHLWAAMLLRDEGELLAYLDLVKRRREFEGMVGWSS
jgi:hypothetical protein